jgi:transcriptional regulator with XRE-family HTH domain
MLNPEVKDAVPEVSYADVMETMGERLKRLRVARGYTQPEFARLVGVTKSAISQWEDDSTKNLKLTTLARVLDVLGTDLQYLVWGENRAPTGTSPGAKPLRRRSGI